MLKEFVVFLINPIAILRYFIQSSILNPFVFIVIFIFLVNSLRSIQNCGIQPITT